MTQTFRGVKARSTLIKDKPASLAAKFMVVAGSRQPGTMWRWQATPLPSLLFTMLTQCEPGICTQSRKHQLFVVGFGTSPLRTAIKKTRYAPVT